MSAMFYKVDNFDRNISSWNVSSVQDFGNMFWGVHHFAQDLCGWGSKVNYQQVNRRGMFEFTACEAQLTYNPYSSGFPTNNWCYVCD